jgi:hypothetical protein
LVERSKQGYTYQRSRRLIYAVVVVVVLLLILIWVWKGSDLGFWVITSLFLIFGILATILICGWLYLLLQELRA